MSILPSKAWQRIYDEIEAEKMRVRFERGQAMETGGEHGAIINRGGDGIMVMDDKLAMRYQRLDKVQQNVGIHFCNALDREHGMKDVLCIWAD